MAVAEKSPAVRIEFCFECGFTRRANKLAGDVMEEFGDFLPGGVTIVPGRSRGLRCLAGRQAALLAQEGRPLPERARGRGSADRDPRRVVRPMATPPLPAAYVERMTSLLGDEAEAFFASYDRPARPGLRVNTQQDLGRGSSSSARPGRWNRSPGARTGSTCRRTRRPASIPGMPPGSITCRNRRPWRRSKPWP